MIPIQQESNIYVDFGGDSIAKLMGELVEINGYRAAAIMTYDGELLYSNGADGSNPNNLAIIMEALNEFFGLACILTEMKGFESCAGVSLRTGDEIMVIRCTAKDCLVGIRLVVCIEERGNVALLQRKLEQILPRIMKSLVWEPDNLVPLYLKESKVDRNRMGKPLRKSTELTMD